MSIDNIIKLLWHSSPYDLYTRIKNRLNKKGDWNYSYEILNSKKHMNTNYLIDRWERYQRIIQIKQPGFSKEIFNFKNKSIFELGCGPVYGWGPIAIFLGATHYYYYEPALIKQVVESKEMKEKYFTPLYDELLCNYGKVISFKEYYEKIINNCKQVDFNEKANVDIILSNSVLEHIPRIEIENILEKLNFILKTGGCFFHSVDFSSHEYGGKGFRALYTRDCNKQLRCLNMLRKNDIQNYLIKTGSKILHATIYKSEEIIRDSINHTWYKYSDKDLTSKVVFYVGQKLRIKNNNET